MKQTTGNIEGFTVRDFREGDFEQVSALWVQTGMGHPCRGDDESTIINTINRGGKLLLLEEITTGAICGTSWLTCDGRRMFLHHFGILPAYQGRKLSHLLLKESLLFVKRTGYQVKLEVHDTNLKAVNLYKKHGFERLGDYDVFIIRDISKIAYYSE